MPARAVLTAAATRHPLARRAALWLAAAALASATLPAEAAELRVMISGGFTAAYKQLGSGFTASSGDTLDTISGPSMGQSKEAIPNRLARGEKADVLIMVGYALDQLIKAGKVIPASRVELADSRIGMVVRAGAPKPDIGTVDQLKDVLLHAKSVAYSDSASGVYVEKEMFRKLGVEDQVKPKAKMVPRIPVASVVASGDYEIGFQQVSELLPVPGVTYAGKVPESVQSVTRFAGGIPVGADHPEDAKKLLDYLASPQAQATVRATGLDSVTMSPAQ
ncbi:MAG: substrate-binding domain-containing protein [Burkholderia sp.]|jgi:molybdate transport system substrate-binding protein|uniref:substrate-binding domain-containing protein n=2 Tax=Burkholderia sp. TaxID=36773 RepID=UPI0025893C22|nr:substrate-binding domain-containing protein [Burkholderia sp.]MCA3781094.1 substrate-binding domain-containing protein [Burkholderia sp.]MCA3795320.1 substrate-binding domain-containing protein [Burkholderia sp.]MCA3805394.1 substrate-binding domain-containing protein [Burkholderia sp.]MCA3815749.1 substrate-binding domain-containing protein [Burkholderia sp.]MCA3825116.1 substrate-binding domain-containing protein [Burkholderia sp.]